jgi:hypothetical protein
MSYYPNLCLASQLANRIDEPLETVELGEDDEIVCCGAGEGEGEGTGTGAGEGEDEGEGEGGELGYDADTEAEARGEVAVYTNFAKVVPLPGRHPELSRGAFPSVVHASFDTYLASLNVATSGPSALPEARVRLLKLYHTAVLKTVSAASKWATPDGRAWNMDPHHPGMDLHVTVTPDAKGCCLRYVSNRVWGDVLRKGVERSNRKGGTWAFTKGWSPFLDAVKADPKEACMTLALLCQGPPMGSTFELKTETGVAAAVDGAFRWRPVLMAYSTKNAMYSAERLSVALHPLTVHIDVTLGV